MDTEKPPQKCPHQTAESLGFNGGTEFLRCLACGAVLVLQNDIRVAIPPLQKAG